MAQRHRPATRSDHHTFCTVEGWSQRRSATCRRGTHHITFELALPDGRILYTRISHPVDRTDYGPGIWKHILRDQLDVTDSEFRACVLDKALPDRGRLEVPTEAIPAGVVRVLVQEARIPEAEVRTMTKAEALQGLTEHYQRDSGAE